MAIIKTEVMSFGAPVGFFRTVSGQFITSCGFAGTLNLYRNCQSMLLSIKKILHYKIYEYQDLSSLAVSEVRDRSYRASPRDRQDMAFRP